MQDKFDEYIEEQILQTDMPESYDCDCRKGYVYNPEREICKRCVGSAKILEKAFFAALFSGRVDIASKILGMTKNKEDKE